MMKYLLKVTCALVLVITLASVTRAFGQDTPQDDRYIVTLQPGNSPEDVATAHGLSPRHVYTHVLNGFAAKIPPGQLVVLSKDQRVAHISPDNEVFAFGKPAPQPSPSALPQVIPAGVARVRPAGTVKETGAGIGVAIVDTGLDFSHQDLPVSRSWSFVARGTLARSAQDDNGHGTHVGGIVAAKDNNIDVVGVAPGATLYAVKVLDRNGSGYDSDIIAGLNSVVANAAKVTPKINVINLSLGRPVSADDSAMHTAVQSVVGAGITVVVAAGNDPSKEISQMVPAGFSEVIAVASSTAMAGASDVTMFVGADSASWFTTDGPGVAISAPGEDQENVQNPYVTSVGILSTAKGGGTTRMYGTSMAAPLATGVVALLLQKHASESLTPAYIKGCIQAGDRVGSAPLPSPTTAATPDNIFEGILYAPTVLTK